MYAARGVMRQLRGADPAHHFRSGLLSAVPAALETEVPTGTTDSSPAGNCWAPSVLPHVTEALPATVGNA